MQVTRCTEDELVESVSVKVTVDQRGIVLDTSHSPRNLFGFDPQAELIGQPLAAFINVFEEFRLKQQQQGLNGRSGSNPGSASSNGSRERGKQEKYSQLALQIGPGPEAANGALSAASGAADDAILLTLLAHAAQEGSEAYYRVGVRSAPLPLDQIGKTASEQAGIAQGDGASLLQMLGKRGGKQMRAALMRVDVVQPDWDNEDADKQGVRFSVSLALHTTHP